MSDAPRWPGWTIPVVLLGLLAGSVLASLAVALLVAAAGADELTPGLVLLLAVVELAVTWLVLWLVARRARIELRPAHLGLRLVRPRMLLVTIGFGLLAVAVAAGLTAALGGVGASHPEELGAESAAIVLDLGTAVVILARAVLFAVAIELVLRGFLLGALASRIGRALAIIVVALLGAATVPGELAPAAVLVGAALCLIYLEAQSILPCVAVSAAAHGLAYGARFDWSAPESVALALAAGAAALALVLGPTRSWDPGPARS